MVSCARDSQAGQSASDDVPGESHLKYKGEKMQNLCMTGLLECKIIRTAKSRCSVLCGKVS